MTGHQTTETSMKLPSAETLQLLLDKSALYELILNYCRAVDRRDFALLETLYHPDSTDDHSPLFQGSGPEFVRQLPKIMQRFAMTRHVITGALFSVAGDIADGEVHVDAYHLLNGEPAREMLFYGRYLDRYERRQGVWRFLERTSVHDWSALRPYDKEASAWVSRGATLGRADENDPVYSRLALVRRGIR